MKGPITRFARFWMGLMLMLGLALTTSCGDPAGENEVGELGMTLSTTNGDVTYRLRHALFQIRGPEDKDVCSEDYGELGDELILVGLRSGDYQVAMNLGTGGMGGSGGVSGSGGSMGGAAGMGGAVGIGGGGGDGGASGA